MNLTFAFHIVVESLRHWKGVWRGLPELKLLPIEGRRVSGFEVQTHDGPAGQELVPPEAQREAE
jgi:hypothetical protein